MFDFLDVDWRSLALPVSYISVLAGMLFTFSTIYRKRKASQLANLEPWFGPHLSKQIYSSLLEISATGEKTKVPDSVIRAALLRRAVADIARIISIRQAKQALNVLLQRGSIGDDMNQRFQRAEKEIEEELREVVMEANALVPGWGNTIFQSANEMAANAMLRERLDEIQAQTEPEKEWWEKRREVIRQDFEKELNEEAGVKTDARGVSDDDGVLVDSGTPAATPGSAKKKKGKK
ncbi:putative Pre protein translocase subunit Sec66-domain-containing protein [Seiridium unicorne]|uniref:Pre protein translocase subunit Sec66-domain-containing protein n=1 Tax=Seiridium unicorne TaxID=138068 RepID=A0ABR2V433_9PEZI